MNYLEIAQDNVADKYPLIVYAKPDYATLPPGAILGTWAISIPGKLRYIMDRESELAPGVMPSDLTRAWLHDAYNLPIKKRREQTIAECYPHPQKALVGKYEDCAYVDIRQAYLRILRLGYNMDYLRNSYIGVNFQPVPKIVEDNKMSYAVAVAMSHSQTSQIQIMGKKGPFTSNHFNIYSNPGLYNFASDTLSAIASEVLRIFGDKVKYVNTDGYIIEMPYVGALMRVIESWGFTSRIKHYGLTSIWGVGSWRVGTERTKYKNMHPQNFLSAMPDKHDSLWLKARVAKLIEETGYRLSQL